MPPQTRLTYATNLLPITFVPLLNLFCLLFMIQVIWPYFILPTSLGVNLPKTITSDSLPENTIAVTVSGENIIYVENKILSEKELKDFLQASQNKNRIILIKADGRSSLNRVVAILDICRQAGFSKINIATTNINK